MRTGTALLEFPRIKRCCDRVISHMEKYHIQPYDENTGKGLVRHVLIRYGFFTDEMMVCLIINGEELPGEDALVKSLREIPETDKCDGECE